MATRRRKFSRQNGEKTLTEKLFSSIEDVNNLSDYCLEVEEGIVALSKNPTACNILLDEMKRLVREAEAQWQKIERTSEFKATYRNRTAAQTDYMNLRS